MKYTSLNDGIASTISRLEALLSKVKTYQPNNLFPIKGDWNQIKVDRCIFCGLKLHFLRKTPRVMCFNKKCPSGSKFNMSLKDYGELKGKLNNPN